MTITFNFPLLIEILTKIIHSIYLVWNYNGYQVSMIFNKDFKLINTYQNSCCDI